MTPLFAACVEGHVEIVKLLIKNKANILHTNIYGQMPLDATSSDEIKKLLLKEYRWFRRRSLILTIPLSDHETNEDNRLTPLGCIITAQFSPDNLLFQLKRMVVSFL